MLYVVYCLLYPMNSRMKSYEVPQTMTITGNLKKGKITKIILLAVFMTYLDVKQLHMFNANIITRHAGHPNLHCHARNRRDDKSDCDPNEPSNIHFKT